MLLASVLIVSHALFIAGCYWFASGIISTAGGSSSRRIVLSSPLFWGLFALLGGLCLLFSPWLLAYLRQALS